MAGALCILGSSGRMGQELQRLAIAEGLALVHTADEASVVIVLGGSVTGQRALLELAEAQRQRTGSLAVVAITCPGGCTRPGGSPRMAS